MHSHAQPMSFALARSAAPALTANSYQLTAGCAQRAAADPLWPRLGDEARRLVLTWEAVAQRLEAAPEKGRELQRLRVDFAGVLQGLSRGTIYRKVSALRAEGAAGVLGKAALRKLGVRDGSTLPKAFITHWRKRCAAHQRMKALSVWHDLMAELIGGAIIPGYDGDWRAIWLLEHPGCLVPARCPYAADHRRNAHPRGWSYRNLKAIAPEVDVWKAATQGVAAARAFLPSLPHTRVGLGPMEVITMDDVWHDVEVLFLNGREMPTHERPVEVGVLDVLTGCHVAWQVWPVRRRADGSREMVDASVQRFIQAQLFCGIGIHPRGLTELLEHGTAGLAEAEVQRINAILARYITPPKGRQWLTVCRSSTTGEPIAKGLFCERACGNPRHKAMIESSWNLLHNALAALPAQVGKDRDHAPADQEGLRREDKALLQMVNDVAKANPAALDILRQAEFHAVSFHKFKEALRLVKARINARTDHTLEGWEGCGFVRHVASLPGGAELDLDAVPESQRAATAALIKQLGAPVALRRMSPMEAFAASTAHAPLVRFPAAAAAEILGPDLAQALTVSPRATLTLRDRFSQELLTYSALAKDEQGATRELTRGATVRVWANPFNPATILVADAEGHVLGICPLLEASRFGDAEADHRNLGLWQQANAEQRKRLEPLLKAKRERAAETRQNLSALIGQAKAAQAAADAKQDLSALQGAVDRARPWPTCAAPCTPAEGLKSAAFDDEKAELCQRPSRQSACGGQDGEKTPALSLKDFI